MFKKFVMQYQVGDRWHTVIATNACLQDLCMGEHARQRQIQKAEMLSVAEEEKIFPHGLDRRSPLAHGELKGVRLRFPGKIPPFSKSQGKADAA